MQSRNYLRVALPKKLVSAFFIFFLVLPVLAVFSSNLPAGAGLSQSPPSAKADAGDEKVYYFLNDHLGSVDVVLDDQGNVVERRDYLPYGAERAQETFSGVPVTALGFTGKERDVETELNYYGARYYDPVTGRFITMDPMLMNLDKMSQSQQNAFLSNLQNLNTYAYVTNNPVNLVDPTGMWGVLPGLGGESHQFITNLALDNASICLTSKTRDNLVNAASLWSDIFVYRLTDEKKSSYNHSTSNGTSMTALEIKSAMLNDAQKWYSSGQIKDLGRLLHMVEDSYATGHVERDSGGNISAFLDAGKQSSVYHIINDNYLDDSGEVKVQANQAAAAATDIINYYYSGTDWDEVKEYLDTEVLKGVNESTSVGISGEFGEE